MFSGTLFPLLVHPTIMGMKVFGFYSRAQGCVTTNDDATNMDHVTN